MRILPFGLYAQVFLLTVLSQRSHIFGKKEKKDFFRVGSKEMEGIHLPKSPSPSVQLGKDLLQYRTEGEKAQRDHEDLHTCFITFSHL